MKLKPLPSVIGIIVGFLVFITLLSAEGLAQRTKSFKLIRSKASVYIEFVKSGKDSEKNERLWLRIHNNQRWGIRMDMGGAASEDGDARLFYDVLDKYDHISDSVSCHVCSTNTLGPGRSLTFSIPKVHLAPVYGIRIKYGFAWEDDLNLDEPQHFTNFLSSDLPEKIKVNK